nr:reverse transcriptase domain-containing protein [Tanacetum cinerariifolium]
LEIHVGYLTRRTMPAFTHLSTSLVTTSLFSGAKHVDDMVIKSRDEKMLLADVAETFDNLRKFNMKLNPKKCSFGVEEEKFLGYMVTWTVEAEEAFQQMKKLILDLFSLTPSFLKETLYAYLAVTKEAVSVVLMTDRKGRQYVTPEKDDTDKWTLFTNRASNLKGSRAGLVLIGPSGIKYTYALHLTFFSTNNEAEYKALLAGLRIARRMNISCIDVKVDSKLVASQINESYVANKDSMIKYLAKAKEYIFGFKSFSIENIPKNINQKAYVLSKLASVAFNHLTKEVLVEVLNKRSTKYQEINTIVKKRKTTG